MKTTYLRNKTRVYHISPEIRLGGTTYEEALNAHSPIKVATTTDYRIFGKKLMSEDVLIYTIQSQSVRKITAALALFRKISDWSYLYRLAKCHSLEREVGALYDVSRMIMRTRRMPKRFRNHALPKRYSRFSDIVPKLRSKHFRNIEETWKVHLPFNKQDLEAYT
ncbi:hypothetical protein GOV09_05685 [Candidatus Woesearchaeota archaeon]|nr:hypothetical protein [Candidatus Woesearchaeota archaeon]